MTTNALGEQEETFRECYEKADIYLARALYHPDLVYVSPTFRIIDRPSWIMTGIEDGLEFIQATLSGIPNIRYEAVCSAIVPGGRAAVARQRVAGGDATQQPDRFDPACVSDRGPNGRRAHQHADQQQLNPAPRHGRPMSPSKAV